MRFYTLLLSFVFSLFIISCASDASSETDDQLTDASISTNAADQIQKKIVMDSAHLLSTKPVVKRIEDLEMSTPTIIQKKKKQPIKEDNQPQLELAKKQENLREVKNEFQPVIKQNTAKIKPVAKPKKEIKEPKSAIKEAEAEKPSSIDLSQFEVTQPTLMQSRSVTFKEAKVYDDMTEYYFIDQRKKLVKIRIDNESDEEQLTMPESLLTTNESGEEIQNPQKIGKPFMISFNSKGVATSIMDLSKTKIK